MILSYEVGLVVFRVCDSQVFLARADHGNYSSKKKRIRDSQASRIGKHIFLVDRFS